jgi:DNA polymerase-3 subunit delta
MIPNLILLTGADDYRLRQRAKFYRTAFRQKYTDGEIEWFDEKSTLAELENSVFTLNLFGGRRLVMMESFWDPDKFDQATKANFFIRLPDFSDSATLIMIMPNLDKRTKASKFWLASAKAEMFDPLDEMGLYRWIEQYTESQSGKISRADAQKLLSRCGENLWNLSREIEKLVLASDTGVIDTEMIDTFTRANPQAVIWDFLGYLSQQRTAQALTAFQQLRAMGESVHQIFAMIMREVRVHAQIRAGLDENLDSKAIATAAGLHPFVVQKTIGATRKFSLDQIRSWYGALSDIDRKLKTGGIVMTTDDTSEFELEIERFILSMGKT